VAGTEILENLCQAVLDGDEAEAIELTELAMAGGANPQTILEQAIQKALARIGEQFDTGECYLPDLILAGDAAKAATTILIPHLAASEGASASRGGVILGSSQGDLHDIGKNIVSALLAAGGMEVTDLGVDVPAKRFLEVAREEKAGVIAMSSLLTTSMPFQEEVVRLLEDAGERGQFFVIVGGGPVTPEWAAQVGADGYGREAPDAVTLCRELLSLEGGPPLENPICIGALR
jgi:methanogenic corrinoid protein MtbC1